MKTFNFLVYFLIIGGLTSCMKENELKKSVFMQDPENLDLPSYSEWGYNTFGAYYDREVFISNDDLVPAKILVFDTTFSFILNGQLGSGYGYYYDYTEMMISFKMAGRLPGDYADLAFLNDSVIDLTNPDCGVVVTIDTVVYNAEILEGELNFKRVQILQVDDLQIEAILSGYFGLKAVLNGKPVTISDGRFDVGISPDNFYQY